MAFSTEGGTSLAFPKPTPTCPERSHRTTSALKLNRRPPLTTVAQRLIFTTRSSKRLSPSSPRPRPPRSERPRPPGPPPGPPPGRPSLVCVLGSLKSSILPHGH